MSRYGFQPLISNAGLLRDSAGYSLIEALTVMAIVAILVVLAAPSFTDFIVTQRLRTAQYDLFNDLIFVRSEAVKRNSTVLIQRSGANWAAGWSVSAGGVTLRSHPALAASVTESTGPASISFGRDGRQTASTTATFTFDDKKGKASIAPRIISLDPSGKPRTS
jgi:type IV fimbrial biogenesis protein FimT